ncbi:phosphatidylinositol phosphatase PTPRQ-like [Hyalella azteca]|uniref:Phosphatidylinositol phosphatase PTPRQ-like n=1 Tax=Hyalella azteca TaxID=294128 RepID=A0A979FKH7_HYAAZ|nr:phosphatidylinositol phosphatase PTPRQ-like [Hyalella azteca]
MSSTQQLPDYANTIDFWLLCQPLPYEHQSPQDVSCSQEEDLSLEVHWTTPSTTCEISQYSVNYTAAVIWSEEIYKNYSLVDAATSEYVIQRPIPYTFYIFEVRAVVKGCGSGEPRSCPVKTKGEPPSAPVSLRVTANTAKSLSIAWDCPLEMSGEFKDFIIRWYPNDEPNGFITTDQTSYTIGSLTPCTEYNVTVAARNNAGEGTPAQTHGATITIAPDHLVCVQNAEDLSLKVRWDAPNPDSGCTVVKYDIATTIDVIWSGETFNNDSSVEASTTQYVVENPVSYSNYTFGVSAVAAGDVKGPTVNCGVTTAQTAPSAPQNLALLEARSDALVVQWDAPAELNGVVVSYLVSSSHGGEVVTNQTLAAPPEQTRFNCTVDGLTAATDYDISVRAVTVKIGAAATSSYRTSTSGQGQPTTAAFATSTPDQGLQTTAGQATSTPDQGQQTTAGIATSTPVLSQPTTAAFATSTPEQGQQTTAGQATSTPDQGQQTTASLATITSEQGQQTTTGQATSTSGQGQQTTNIFGTSQGLTTVPEVSTVYSSTKISSSKLPSTSKYTTMEPVTTRPFTLDLSTDTLTTTHEQDFSDPRLSAGVIAGIVMAVIAGITLTVFAVVTLVRKKIFHFLE